MQMCSDDCFDMTPRTNAGDGPVTQTLSSRAREVNYCTGRLPLPESLSSQRIVYRDSKIRCLPGPLHHGTPWSTASAPNSDESYFPTPINNGCNELAPPEGALRYANALWSNWRQR